MPAGALPLDPTELKTMSSSQLLASNDTVLQAAVKDLSS
jgi:hypothetical protein